MPSATLKLTRKEGVKNFNPVKSGFSASTLQRTPWSSFFFFKPCPQVLNLESRIRLLSKKLPSVMYAQSLKGKKNILTVINGRERWGLKKKKLVRMTEPVINSARARQLWNWPNRVIEMVTHQKVTITWVNGKRVAPSRDLPLEVRALLLPIRNAMGYVCLNEIEGFFPFLFIFF